MANNRSLWQRTKPFWVSLGAFLGAIAAITGITGYTVKDIIQAVFPKKKEGCVVLDYRGKNAVFARVSVANLGLVPVILNELNTAYKIGTVIAQEPIPGKILEECTGQVVLQVSADPQTVADTPTEYPSTPLTINNKPPINTGRILVFSAFLLGICYLIYKVIDNDFF